MHTFPICSISAHLIHDGDIHIIRESSIDRDEAMPEPIGVTLLITKHAQISREEIISNLINRPVRAVSHPVDVNCGGIGARYISWVCHKN